MPPDPSEDAATTLAPARSLPARLRSRITRELRLASHAITASSEPALFQLAIDLQRGDTSSLRRLQWLPALRIARRAARLRGPPQPDPLAVLSADFVRYCLRHYCDSNSQLLQDLLVTFMLGDRKHGYAVEFGVADGVSRSNTLSLERRGWQTLVAEPARSAHASLSRNRRGELDFRCVWSQTGEQLEFVEAANPELSTILDYADRDHHAGRRAGGERYLVETVSLLDLLRSHEAPLTIDYLSVDTEGSEFEILSHFDFSEYAIKVITVEHNHVSEDRTGLYELLTAHSFVRVFTHLSNFDDWYIHQSVLDDRHASASSNVR